MDSNVEMARRAVESMRVAPVRQHKSVNKISLATVAWAVRYSLAATESERARAANIEVGKLAALAFAREPQELVQLGADLITWLFLFDDAIGEAPREMAESQHRQLLAKYSRVIMERQLPEDATSFHHALLDLVRRAMVLGDNEPWLDRFASDMRGYFSGCADESRHRRAQRAPSVREYRELRLRTVGTSPVFALIELGVGGILSAAEAASAEVIHARELAALLTAWVNDVYSFPKETRANDPLNLVIAIAAEQTLCAPDALARAVAIYNSDLEELEGLIQTLQRSGSPALNAYLDGLLAWVHGNRVWTRLCGRYN
jgi:hypothetical protein